MKKLIYLFALVILISGCMTMTTGIGKKEIDSNLISQIELNKTTKADILKLFGNPHSISTTATGQEGYKYVFMETKSKVTPIPFNTKMSVDTRYQELNVMFKGDIVADYTSIRR